MTLRGTKTDASEDDLPPPLTLSSFAHTRSGDGGWNGVGSQGDDGNSSGGRGSDVRNPWRGDVSGGSNRGRPLHGARMLLSRLTTLRLLLSL